MLRKTYKRILSTILVCVIIASCTGIMSLATYATQYKEYGIDASSWQGEMDWSIVAKDKNVDFVILRAGYTYYDGPKEDIRFKEYYDGCRKNNLKVGVYFYSYAESVEEARNDAKWLINLLKGKYFEYPIYLDMEDNSILYLGKEKLTEITIAFNETMRSAGYCAGVYASQSWFTNYLDKDKFVELGYDIWLAYWSSTGTANVDRSEECGMWQYHNNGSINGIDNRSFDLNISYIDYASYMKEHSLNGYQNLIAPEKPSVTVYATTDADNSVMISTESENALSYEYRIYNSNTNELVRASSNEETSIYSAALPVGDYYVIASAVNLEIKKNGGKNWFTDSDKVYFSIFEGSTAPIATINENGHIYELYANTLTWAEANSKCEELGGHLVTITNEKEQSLLTALTEEDLYVWTGAVLGAPENIWGWMTDEYFRYTNWNDEQFDDSSFGVTTRSYIVMNTKDGKWQESSNICFINPELRCGYICEYGENDYTSQVIIDAKEGSFENEYEFTFPINGINSPRTSGSIIVYTVNPSNNQYGVEYAVNSDGYITAVRGYGNTTKITVPENGFIVSVHAGNEMISLYSNFKVGERMVFDSDTMTLKAYTNRIGIFYTNEYGELVDYEMPSNPGLLLKGWSYSKSLSSIDFTYEDKISTTRDIRIYTIWEDLCRGNHTPSEIEIIENSVGATCETEGVYDSVHYCEICNIEVSRKTVITEAIGHRFIEGTCKLCGKTSMSVADTAPMIIIDSSVARVNGNEVTLKVRFFNNPGISSFSFGIDYDKELFELESVNLNPVFDGEFTVDEKIAFTSNENITETDIMDITFKVVSQNIAPETPVSLIYNSDEILNARGESVRFIMLPGYLEVLEAASKGDINQDGKINAIDSNIMQKIIVGSYAFDINKMSTADMNDDKKVNAVDKSLLSRAIVS